MRHGPETTFHIPPRNDVPNCIAEEDAVPVEGYLLMLGGVPAAGGVGCVEGLSLGAATLPLTAQ
jgi:hypothetical protein